MTTVEIDDVAPAGRVRTAADVMSAPVVTVSVHDTVWKAWGLLYRSGLRHLVVVDGVRVRGLIDDRRITAEWPLGPIGPHRRMVGDVVGRRVHCVLPETPARIVAEIMLDDRTDAVPVVTERGEILGLITTSDLLRELVGRDG
ncbi:MAG: HPP family protein [Actinomycetes bacterium]